MVDVYKRKGDWKLLVTFLVADLLYLAIPTNEDQSVMAGSRGRRRRRKRISFGSSLSR
jgi:hypothetical protein